MTKIYRRILVCAALCVTTIVAASADASNVDHIQPPTLSWNTTSTSCWNTGYSALTYTCGSGTGGVLLNLENVSPADNAIHTYVTASGGTPSSPEVCCQVTSTNDQQSSSWSGSTVCTAGGGSGVYQTLNLGSVYVPYTSPGTTLGNFGYSYVWCTATPGLTGPPVISAVHYVD